MSIRRLGAMLTFLLLGLSCGVSSDSAPSLPDPPTLNSAKMPQLEMEWDGYHFLVREDRKVYAYDSSGTLVEVYDLTEDRTPPRLTWDGVAFGWE